MQILFLLLLIPITYAKLLAGGMLGYSFMAVQGDGQVYAWGNNEYGLLGIGSSVETQLNPTKLFNVANASDVSIGGAHSCIVDLGRAKCAGFGLYLGRKSTANDSNVMVNVEGLSGVSQVFVGYAHSCLLTISGKVWCWGFAANGRLANPRTPSDSIPGKVAGYGENKAAFGVASGASHTCVLFIDGTVGCAGFDVYGQLGVGDSIDRSILTQIDLPNVASISAGGTHTCAATKRGDVYCWGSGYFAQLGLGQNVNLNAPTRKVPGIPPAAEVWCGAGQTFVILGSNRSIVGFGYNQHATLTEGGESMYLETPTTLYKGQAGILEVRGGYSAVCILLESGQIKCIGSNEYSQLGRRTVSVDNNPLDSVLAIKTQYDKCTPKKRTNKTACTRLIETCKRSGVVMKWFGAGCIMNGTQAFDGGCQCDGYCGFTCESVCNNSPGNLCEWDVALNACKVRGEDKAYERFGKQCV